MKQIIKHIFKGILIFYSSIVFTQSTTQYVGILKIVGNPCTTDPCLPGVVWSLKTDTADFILSIDDSWNWGDDLIINNTQYFENDSLTIIGSDTTKYDIIGNPFYELEVYDVLTNLINIQQNKIHLYPNPCYDLLFLESTYLIKEIYLFTISGQLIYDWQSNNNQVSFNLDWLKKGTYILNVVYDNKKNNNYAIVKK